MRKLTKMMKGLQKNIHAIYPTNLTVPNPATQHRALLSCPQDTNVKKRGKLCRPNRKEQLHEGENRPNLNNDNIRKKKNKKRKAENELTRSDQSTKPP